jgi:hypothetical protein
MIRPANNRLQRTALPLNRGVIQMQGNCYVPKLITEPKTFHI